MSRRRQRGLSAEDAALWQGVARSVRPMRAAPSPPTPPGLPPPPPPPPPPAPEPPLPPSRPEPPLLLPRVRPDGPRTSAAVLPAPVGTLGPATPGLDRRTAERLRRGRTDPEARLDLHGRTLEAAHSELAAFIRRVHGQGMRVVLVITGKGRPQPEGWFARGGGALRENVPRWLGLPPLAALVVGVYPAHARHGGGGAFYVYLKRSGGGR